MPYIIEVVQAGRTVEVMKYYSSRYGKKGIKRGERKALTKEEQIKVNKRAAEKKLRRLKQLVTNSRLPSKLMI